MPPPTTGRPSTTGRHWAVRAPDADAPELQPAWPDDVAAGTDVAAGADAAGDVTGAAPASGDAVEPAAPVVGWTDSAGHSSRPAWPVPIVAAEPVTLDPVPPAAAPALRVPAPPAGAAADRRPRAGDSAPPGRSQLDGGALPATVPGLRRRWRAGRAVVSSRRSVPVSAPGDFATPARIGAAQRYRLALRATDRSLNLEQMVRSAPVDHCRVIAVVSPKGGTGKTTITALLGTLLAELRRDPVIALDANPDLGDLVHKLSGDDPVGGAVVDDLAVWLREHPQAPPAQLWSRLGIGPHGLRYVSTPRPPAGAAERMIAAADFELYRGLIARLRDYAGIVLVDCGTGLLDPPVQAALEAADQIVLVTDSAVPTARQVVAAAELLPGGTPIWLVANKMPDRGARVDLRKVVAAIARLEGLTVVPVPRGRRPAEAIVTPAFRWSGAPAEWQQPMRELAARLASGWHLHPADG